MAPGSDHRQLDLGRLLARLACGVFALVGALPLLGGLLVRSEPVRVWAAEQTRQILADQLGLTASYRVEMELWPLRVSLHDVTVPSTDGRGAALRAARIAVTPRVFSLLAGRLHVGDIEIDAPQVRLVVEDGKLQNVRYRLPETPGPSKRLERAPFSSLAVSDAHFEVSVDGIQSSLGSVDLDVFGDVGPSFEVVLRVGEGSLRRERRAFPRKDEPDAAPRRVFDDDAICRLDLRARYEPGHALIRRFALLALADEDPAKNTPAPCPDRSEDDPRRLALAVSDFRLELGKKPAPALGGQINVRAPTRLTNRFVATGALHGFVQLGGTLQHDGQSVLPEFRGKLSGQGLGIEGYRLAERLDADLLINSEVVLIPRLFMRFADGDVRLTNAKIDPLAPGVPIRVERVDGDGMQFPGLMRDLDVTPDTIVKWDLHKTRVTNIRGRIDPLQIDADITGETRDFEVFDRAFHDPARKHVIGVRAASLRGRLGVRPNAFEIYDTRTEFAGSSIFVKLVSIGFSNELKLEIQGGSKIDLAKVSPLLDIPMAGIAELGDTKMQGQGSDPVLEGQVAIQGFEFGGFPIGDLLGTKVRFRPLKIDLSEGRARKGRSEFSVPSARLDFDTQASIVVDAELRSKSFDVRDFFAIWLFDKDPRFDQIHGTLDVGAKVHYALGGPEDRCSGGRLHVSGATKLSGLDLFEERYDSGHAQFDFDWVDRYASYLGFRLEVPSITLRKGEGVIFGSMTVEPGALLGGHFVATGVPVSRIDAMAGMLAGADAQVSGVAELGGSIDAMKLSGHGRVSPVRIGGGMLPGSDFQVALEPIVRRPESSGNTRCGRPIPTPFDPAEYAADRAQGTFRVGGELFGGQIELKDLTITRQRAKIVRGGVEAVGLDLGALAELAPQVALSDTKLSGRLSAHAEIAELAMQQPSKAKIELGISKLELERAGVRAELLESKAPLTLQAGQLGLPGLTLAVSSPGGRSAVLDVSGSVKNLGKAPLVDADVELRPIQLGALAGALPRVERAAGSLAGNFHVQGRPDALRYSGEFNLKNGELALRGLPAPITNAELRIRLDNDEVRIESGSARMGSGTLSLRGSAPLRGLSLGALRVALNARDLTFSGGQGIKALVDADLVTTWEPRVTDAELPEITGSVTLKRFRYERPVIMTADLSSLAQRGKRTEVESYDPEDDVVQFDVNVRAGQSLLIKNNLTESELVFENGGLQLSGTNQRFGLRGTLRLKPGGKIWLRRNEFEIRQGFVRFDDLTRIAPQVDVTAVTEYRRYSDSVASGTESPASGAQPSASRTASAAGGRWRITMRAHGDADKLNVDLTSEPALAQDDIFLLLTVGLTRAELDQARSASAGESVALEALGTLTGADRAVAQAVPVIDEFRFGTAYSSKTGRTEPTITVGKRLAERLRANVTSGLSESREVRSNVEWRLNPRLSVEGSYDNVNDISTSSVGNVGADIRWRLEFE